MKSRMHHRLEDFDSTALQQLCINLNKAFQGFFDPKRPDHYPHFKCKYGRQSSYHCTSISNGESWIKATKLKPIKARIHRELVGKFKSITLERTITCKYYASLLIDDRIATPAPQETVDAVLCLDTELSHLAIYSQGKKTANQRFLKRAQANLRRKQKELSCC